MQALSIRQPYAELILRGIKTAELRSRPTRRIGERFYIYAAKAKAAPIKIWSDDLRVAAPPAWMIELAKQVGMIEANALMQTGMIVGSAVIADCTFDEGIYRWRLTEVERLAHPRKPTGHPQPVWFRPFD